jgi:hypothetical protein
MPAYKTIILELLQEKPDVYEHLRSTKRLLPTLEVYAKELKALHETWMEMIRQERPHSDPIQVSSEALDLAVVGIHDRLLSASAKDEAEALMFLDGAMSYIRHHTPRA